MNSKFFYYSLALGSLFLIFINTVSPNFLWAKIIFFFILFCFFTSISYIFSVHHLLNLIVSLYLLILIILAFFRQSSWFNIIILTCLFAVFYKIIPTQKPITK